jgi:hypothetical protein
MAPAATDNKSNDDDDEDAAPRDALNLVVSAVVTKLA